jgi:aerobic carbon-monoxide dehydrogenase medium subunit
MKPAQFEYYRAGSLDEAVGLLIQHGPEARILSGGQSLLPLMKLRLARPSALVDLGRVRELDYVREADGHLAFGAMARLDALESDVVRSRCPLLAEAARHIGHPAIRHRGTVCGSLAHADPAAELPVLALALDAEMVATGRDGPRVISAAEFFVTTFSTRLDPGEILSEARFPAASPDTGWGFVELSRRPGDFAIAVAVAVLETRPDGRIGKARVAVGAVADRAIRCPDAEAALQNQQPGPAAFQAAAEVAAAPLDPPSDVHGSSAYRRHVAAVLVRRALVQAWERAGGQRRQMN